MCSPNRLLFLLKYGITYFHKTKERPDGSIEQIDQKHIMRYPQFFAALEVRKRIAEGIKSGIIWHTQGSETLDRGESSGVEKFLLRCLWP